MIDLAQLVIFIPAALALNLTPGSDMLFCLGQGLKSGPRAGIAASFGVASGSLIHILLAAFGLAALLAAYPFAFEIVRWAGVAYLVWLAIQAVWNRNATLSAAQVGSGTIFVAWRDGALVNLLNPKVAIFVLAFVPQFVDPARGSTMLQFLILGAILNVGGTVINCAVGAFSGSIGRTLTSSAALTTAYRWVTCSIFLGLAAKLAFDRR
ncbi:LysE family translocator [Pelagibius sp. Alg239-R121]|uniref:LysE family translocator n=1 Tax=Pelagibius sp. Alg239-R121 TaxID=2993448 RepID=UPI0024A63065|nr:LysE family translocator [Pelagibius sp. Alg239-R121]